MCVHECGCVCVREREPCLPRDACRCYCPHTPSSPSATTSACPALSSCDVCFRALHARLSFGWLCTCGSVRLTGVYFSLVDAYACVSLCRYGQLGHSPDKPSNVGPRAMLGMGSGQRRVIQIACGDEHTVLLTTTGEVYTCGNGVHGALGHGHRSVCVCSVDVVFVCRGCFRICV